MTQDEVALVQSTFKAVLPIKEQAADLFYGRLFTLDPGLRPMFPAEMAEQKTKLMATLATVVGKLHALDEITGAVQDLGRRHVAYGVKPEQYETVGSALLWTLEQGLGPAFTPAVKAAWTAAYTLLAGAMIAAAESEPVAA